MDDRRLTRLLAGLLERADFAGGGQIGSEELSGWPDGAHELLVGLHLLARASNERGLVCDECEERCWLEPTRTTDAQGHDVLVHACTQGKVVGLLVFPPSRLVAWRLDLEGLAAAIGTAVGVDADVQEIMPGWAWEIGRAEIAGRTRRVYLVSGLGGPRGEPRWADLRRRLPPEDVVVFVPARAPSEIAGEDAAVVPLVGLLEIVEGRVWLAPDRIERALRGPRWTAAATVEEASITHRAAPESQWNQVKIWLVDGDTVRLSVPGRRPQSFTAAQLGLTHGRSKDRQHTKGWQILEALCEGHGACGWRATGSTFPAFKVQVSGLRKKLKEVIGIGGNPFHPQAERRELRARFEAGPLPGPQPYVGEDAWADL